MNKVFCAAVMLVLAMHARCIEFRGKISPICFEIEQRIVGKSWVANPHIQLDDLRYLTISHLNYNENVVLGEMIVHKDVAREVLEIFKLLFDVRFPIEKMHLIDDYFCEGMLLREVDNVSVADNNTSAFFYRMIGGTNTVSEHGLSIAIDINPRVNPYYNPLTGYICPKDARKFCDRSRTDVLGLITEESVCYKAFAKFGWKWGGSWENVKDYQHFCLKEMIPEYFNS